MPWIEGMPSKRLIFVDDLEVWVIEKKRIKNVNLRVQPDGRIEVSVPYATPDEHVEDIVREKHDWLLKAQKKMNQLGTMKLCHVNESNMEVFSITGFDSILTIE